MLSLHIGTTTLLNPEAQDGLDRLLKNNTFLNKYNFSYFHNSFRQLRLTAVSLLVLLID